MNIDTFSTSVIIADFKSYDRYILIYYNKILYYTSYKFRYYNTNILNG